MPGIYSLISPTNKVYIGQTRRPFKLRQGEYKRHSCEKQPKLYASLCKHGYENHIFNIEQEYPYWMPMDSDLLNAYEISIYNAYVAAGYDVLNTKAPGNQGLHSEETRQKISRKLTGKKRNPESVRAGIETKLKNKTTGKGAPKSQAVKDKISKTLTGRKVPAETIAKREATMKRLNIRERRKGIKFKKKGDTNQMTLF